MSLVLLEFGVVLVPKEGKRQLRTSTVAHSDMTRFCNKPIENEMYVQHTAFI